MYNNNVMEVVNKNFKKKKKKKNLNIIETKLLFTEKDNK
jgi:hypothetical protein